MLHSIKQSAKKILMLIVTLSPIALTTACTDNSALIAEIDELNKSITEIDFQIYEVKKSLELVTNERSWVGNLVDSDGAAKPHKVKLKELEKQKKIIEKDVVKLMDELEAEGFSLLSVIGIVIASIVILSGFAFLAFINNIFISNGT